MQWIIKVDHPSSQLHHVGPPGKEMFRSLDKKLAAALNNPKVARNELGRRMHQFNEDCIRLEGRTALGRELLLLIFQYYKTGIHAEAQYSLRDLDKVKLHKNNLEQFQNDWNQVLSGLVMDPDQYYMEQCYYDAIKRYPGLSVEIAWYDRIDRPTATSPGHPDKCYQYLYNCVQRKLRQERENYILQQKEKGFSHHQLQAAPAASPAGAPGQRARSETPGGKKVCKFFLQGNCTKGKDCKFSHPANSGAPATGKGKGKDRRPRSKSRDKGKGKGKDRSKTLPKDKKKIPCKFFSQGKCTANPCPYSHAKGAGKDKERKPSPGGKGKSKAKAKATTKAGAKAKAAGAAISAINTACVALTLSSAPAEVVRKPRDENLCAAATHNVKGEDFLFEKRYLLDTGCGYDLTSRKNM